MNSSLRSVKSSLTLALSLAALCALNVPQANAQVVIAPNPPVIGSSNTVSADPPVAHPHTTPCVVPLFTNLEFADFNTKNFTYTPPAGCKGPWAKVVFSADFTVTAGRQYDRTAQFFLGGANIYFGTTAEPRSALSPSWHVESNVTDLSALFNSPQAGTAILGNFVGVYQGVTYDGIIYANAQLSFYPAEDRDDAPHTPDLVIGMPGNSGATTLNTTTSQLTQTVTLPTNVEKAYLDVIAQSQSNDEFWYLCVPNDQTGPLESCGNTGFRETEISIDGIPAGVAPVYPWIFTGGIDPYLWEPIPGVQTLNFKPYRVDLTPFAGVLSNGLPHTVAISVFNANSYFSATGNLLIFTDKNAKKTTGEVISNNLAAEPAPVISENVNTDSSGNITGSVSVTSSRKYSIVGKLHTSHGLVTSTVNGELNFSNVQTFVIPFNQTEYKQSLVQGTTGHLTTKTEEGGFTDVTTQDLSYPFTFVYDQVENADGTYSIANISDQKYLVTRKPSFDPHGPWSDDFLGTSESNEVSSSDTLNYDASFNFTGHTGSSKQTYVSKGADGACYSRTLTSKNAALTSDVSGAACHHNSH